MSTQVLAGARSGLWGMITRLTVQPWHGGLAACVRSFFSDSPFGDNLSEEEFAFCLLLIAAHV